MTALQQSWFSFMGSFNDFYPPPRTDVLAPQVVPLLGDPLGKKMEPLWSPGTDGDRFSEVTSGVFGVSPCKQLPDQVAREANSDHFSLQLIHHITGAEFIQRRDL